MKRWILSALLSTACGAAFAAPFQFALIGDLPYGEREERLLGVVLSNIDRSPARFTVHVGDIKAGDERCDDELLNRRKELLDRSEKPLVIVPGDNEWSDCTRQSNGGYDAVERLSKLRDILYPGDESLGVKKMDVIRQSASHKFRSYRENMRWEMEGVLFVTLNVPGSNNHYRTGAGRNGEFEERMIANKAWLERAFTIAKRKELKGVVLITHANPLFNRTESKTRDGYQEWKKWLLDYARNFSGEILFVHGDTHMYRFDHPLTQADGTPLTRFTRVETFGSPFALNWVKVSADVSKSPIFQVEPISVEWSAPTVR